MINIINFYKDTNNEQTTKIYISNNTNDDFIFKFLVKDNNLCHITPPKDLIKNNETKEIKKNKVMIYSKSWISK